MQIEDPFCLQDVVAPILKKGDAARMLFVERVVLQFNGFPEGWCTILCPDDVANILKLLVEANAARELAMAAIVRPGPVSLIQLLDTYQRFLNDVRNELQSVSSVQGAGLQSCCTVRHPF